MPAFETFTQKSARSGAGPLVSIQRGGVFSLNADAFAVLGKPSAVEFVFDPQERVMGFRPTTAESPHSYAVRKQRQTESYLVSGRAFSKHAGISIEHAARYKAEMIDGVLAVDLKQNPVNASKPRPKKPVRTSGAAPLTDQAHPTPGAR